ncbi:MAG: endo-1,4-beta-xylanase [Ktedonobacteraceae bacterium]
MNRKMLPLILILYFLVACGTVPTTEIVARVPLTLRTLAQTHHILLGTAVNVDALQHDVAYDNTLAREFDVVTPENVMKFDALHPAKNTYTFAQADALVAFAKAHNMQVRGHNLVWYQALPAWIAKGNFTRDQLLAVLKDHIFTVVTHYRGQVNMWDVVNEAIGDDGTMRNSIWYRDIGPDYLDWAFRWAHEANPQAHLFYNDYAAEGLNPKSDAVYTLVKDMLQRGIPIYGVGLQMHTSILNAPVEQDVKSNMQRLAALGLKVQITEMDVQIQGDMQPMAQRLSRQAQTYHDMLNVCLIVKTCEAFIMWGFTDRYTWIPRATGHSDAPLIFDMSYQPKPAYTAILQELKQ